MSKSQSNHNKKMNDNQGYFGPDITNVQKSEEYRRSREVEEAIDNERLSKWQRFMAFFQNGRLRFVTGIILLLTGIYLLISFLSIPADLVPVVLPVGRNERPESHHQLLDDRERPSA